MTASMEALEVAYGGLVDLVESLDESRSWAPTRCAGWVVRDLLVHLLDDAQRGLVALAVPTDDVPDTDAMTYWQHAPGAPDPQSSGIRTLRTIASQWNLPYLASTYGETVHAVCALARRTSPRAAIRTQGRTLLVEDLLATLTVEAVIHHLDLIVALDDQEPGPAALAVVRRTLDGLLGRLTPSDWSDTEWALVATGRVAPDAGYRQWLGPDVSRLPLLH